MGVGLLQVDAPVRRAAGAHEYPLLRQLTLAALCLLWFIPGVTGRAPWKPTEVTVVPAVVESMAAGDLMVPRLLGDPLPTLPPLVNMVAGGAVWLASPPLQPHEAMRLGSLLWLVLGLGLAGAAVGWHHGSRIGWRAVLLVAGSPGLLLHARTVNPDLALLPLAVGGMVGAHLLRTRPTQGVLALLACTWLGLWACGPIAFWYVALLVLLTSWRGAGQFHHRWMAVAVVLTLCLGGLWLWQDLLAHHSAEQVFWHKTNQLAALQPREVFVNLQSLIGDAAWILWPALPYAALAVAQLRDRAWPAEVRLGLLATIAAALAVVLAGGYEESRTLLLLPLVALMAAVSITGLNREIAKVMDWFAIIVIGGGLIGFFWLTWVLAAMGWSPQLVDWLTRQGIDQPQLSWHAAAAVLATLLWIGLMLRIGRSTERSVLNWMAGTTMGWWVFTLLWLPAVDRARGYADMAASLAAALPPSACVQARDVPDVALAQLEYFTGQRLSGGADCPWVLRPVSDAGGRAPAWTGRRSADRPDRALGLYRVG